MMNQGNDPRQLDLVAGANRQRGRPVTGTARTAAQRQQDRRARLKDAGIATLTVRLPVEVIEALNKFIRFKDITQDSVIEKLLRQQLLRKR